MSKVLYIKANPKSDTESRTFRISKKFVEAYKKLHPEDEIITLDLYKEKIDFLSNEGAQHKPVTPGEDRRHPVIKYAYQFAEADKYVFAEPMWNLGIPAILKAYFDYVMVAGVTFKYTADGVLGLCIDKKAVNISARGGGYTDGPYADLEMGDRYIRNALGFMGVTNVKTITAEMLDVIGIDVEANVGQAIKEAQEFAAIF